MTNESDNENTIIPSADIPPAEDKHGFNPLSKYAISAAIIVSIIVTTAVMLNKQLNTASNNLAEIKAEIDTTRTQAQNLVKAKKLKTSENTASSQPAVASVTVATGIETKHSEKTGNVAPATQVTKESSKTASTTLPATPSGQIAKTEKLPVSSKKAATVAIQPSPAPTMKKENKVLAVVTDREMATTMTMQKRAMPVPAENWSHSRFYQNRQNNMAQNIARHERFMAENSAYAKAMRARQKRNMAEAFHRMDAIDAEQLQQLESNQRRQIAALQEQLGRQQNMINATINRDKEILRMRRMAVQRAQQQRQYILNHL